MRALAIDADIGVTQYCGIAAQEEDVPKQLHDRVTVVGELIFRDGLALDLHHDGIAYDTQLLGDGRLTGLAIGREHRNT